MLTARLAGVVKRLLHRVCQCSVLGLPVYGAAGMAVNGSCKRGAASRVYWVMVYWASLLVTAGRRLQLADYTNRARYVQRCG